MSAPAFLHDFSSPQLKKERATRHPGVAAVAEITAGLFIIPWVENNMHVQRFWHNNTEILLIIRSYF